MRLIDAPIGIFRFDGELVLKTEYYSKDKQSGKYIPNCYIIRTGEYFWGSAKTANELINLDIELVDLVELLPTVTDTISRKQAINALDECYCGGEDSCGEPWVYKENAVEAIQMIEPIPSAQPLEDIHREKEQAYYCGYEDGKAAQWDWLKTEIKRMKMTYTICLNHDYYTGYMSALSAVEGCIAQLEGDAE